MKRVLPILILISLILSSCSGLLWEGRNGLDLTVSIDNPFYQSSSRVSNSRALALQGKFLYIELALIQDQASYNSDTGKLMSGNGNWVDTAWGGHGIVSLDLSDLTETVEATFSDVPRDVGLKARVLLDTDEQTFIDGMNFNYGEVGPLCYSYNSSAPDIFDPVGSGADRYDWFWVDIASTDLADNILSIPIRPEYPDYYSAFGPMDIDPGQTDTYIDDVSALYSNSEPQPGNTKFSSIDIYMVTGEVDVYIRDIAFYVSVDADLTAGLPLPGLVQIHNEDGTPADVSYSGDIYSAIPSYPYKSIQYYFPQLDSSYSLNGDFFSSTIFTGSELINGAVYTFGTHTYDVSYGIAYDGAFSFNAYDLIFEWDPPFGLGVGDLEYKVVYIEGASLTEAEWDTVAEVEALTTTVHIDWSDCSSFYGTGSNPNGFYDITGSAMLSNVYAVVLARFPGGEPFIYAKQFSI